MARAVAIALIALVAVCLVADAAAQTPFCRTSAYQLNLKIVEANKAKMYANCKADVKVIKTGTKDGCAFIVQKVKDEATWKAYSECEKNADNANLYGPLKSASDPCKTLQSSGECPKN